MGKEIVDYRDVLTRLEKSVETNDWCELRPEEAWVLREHVRFLQDSLDGKSLIPPVASR